MEIIYYIEGAMILGILSAYGTVKLIESITIDAEKEKKNDDK